MLEDEFLQASLPLFENGEVDVIEWSFDVGWSRPALHLDHQDLDFDDLSLGDRSSH